MPIASVKKQLQITHRLPHLHFDPVEAAGMANLIISEVTNYGKFNQRYGNR